MENEELGMKTQNEKLCVDSGRFLKLGDFLLCRAQHLAAFFGERHALFVEREHLIKRRRALVECANDVLKARELGFKCAFGGLFFFHGVVCSKRLLPVVHAIDNGRSQVKFFAIDAVFDNADVLCEPEAYIATQIRKLKVWWLW